MQAIQIATIVHNLIAGSNFVQRVELCFQRPTSLTPIDVLALDSIAGQLEQENITLTYDLGRYSSKFNDLTQATSEAVIIDGHDGTVINTRQKNGTNYTNSLRRNRFFDVNRIQKHSAIGTRFTNFKIGKI